MIYTVHLKRVAAVYTTKFQNNYFQNHQRAIIGRFTGNTDPFKKPTLFSTFIIVSPGLWWDNVRLLRYQPKSFLPVYTDTINGFIAVGREGKIMEGDTNKLIYILKTGQKGNRIIHTERFANEDHASIMRHAVYNAFAANDKRKEHPKTP